MGKLNNDTLILLKFFNQLTYLCLWSDFDYLMLGKSKMTENEIDPNMMKKEVWNIIVSSTSVLIRIFYYLK